MTDIESKCRILGKLWMDYRDDPDFVDFIEYNDLGLPMAYMVNTGLSNLTDEGMKYVNETYNLFCLAIGVDEEKEFDNLNEMLQESEEG